MTEVFKTTVTNPQVANILIHRIRQLFPFYKVNFDLQDCDRILRISSTLGAIDSIGIVRVIQSSGFEAEVLPDHTCAPAHLGTTSVIRFGKLTMISS